jgi:hypothetical protein
MAYGKVKNGQRQKVKNDGQFMRSVLMSHRGLAQTANASGRPCGPILMKSGCL